MTTVPTLAEMRHALGETSSSEDTLAETPTLAEMMHANALYQTDPEAYLEHYGVKGMKWGVTRSRAALGRLTGRGKKPTTELKNEEGGVVGGIRAASRAGAQKLKDMREGSTLILEDANGASKVMAKQKDGTFKEVYLSADAERVLRTTKKDQSEMSDKEINDAINRSKKIEEYNKLFNPQPNPNADLAARAQAMDLEVKIKQAQAMLNPPKEKAVQKFIKTVAGGYSAYGQLNTAMNGQLDPLVKSMVDDLRASASASRNASNAKTEAKQERQDAEDRFWSGGTSTTKGTYRVPTGTTFSKPSASEQKKVDDFVYDITSMGKSDPNNPFYNATTPIPPYYPELTERSD